MASKAIGFLNFKFGADLSGFEKAMKKAQKKLKKFGKSVEKTGKNLTTSLTLPIAALGVASIKAFDEQQKAIAQVEAGLKSTGNSVGITSEKLQQMAADLQKTTLFGDEEILKGATAQLLTFTNITGEQFKKTQKVALDLATRLDGDLKSASIMLGKALNDPVANLSALSRAGIQFSEEQKSTVKSMVEMNDLAGAQTLILAELEKQYGGSAEAAAQAGMGPITQLTNQLSDLSEQIGARLIPYVKQFTTWVVGLAEKFDNLSESQKDNIVKWGLILAAIGPILIIIGKLSFGISALIPIFTKLGTFLLANPWIILASAVALVAFEIYEYTSSLSELELVQSSINRINENAIASTFTQTKKIKDLTSVINSENASLTEKETALNNLKKISPEYYNTFSKIEGNIIAITNATKDLTAELLLNAKITSAQSELASLFEKGADDLNSFKTFQYYMETGRVAAGTPLLDVGPEDIRAADNTISQINAITELLSQWETKQNSVTSSIKSTNIILTETNGVFETTNNEVEETTKSFKDFQSSISETAIVWDTYANSMSNAEDQFEGIVFWQSQLTDNQKLLNAGIGMFGDVLTSSLDSALNSQESFFAVFIENIKKAIKSLLIQLAVMSLINMMMGGGAAAFSMASIKTNLGSLMGVPAFAEGGLVTGPTTALIGEGPGTNAGNPEVVAPLDKLKSMMGGGSQHIEVTGKLVGNDIYLSNSKTGTNRERSV